MARYSVRMYSSYVDEFEVEANSADEACDLADQYLYVMDFSQHGDLEKLTGKVECLTKHEYVDHDQTMVNELDEDGNWIE